MKKSISIILAAAILASATAAFAEGEDPAPEGITASVTGNNIGNIFYDKAPVELTVSFKNNDSSKNMLDAVYTVTNEDGKQIAAGEFEDGSLNGGQELEQKVSLGVLDYDTYKLNITNAGKTETFRFSSAVKSKSSNKNDSLGVCTHLNRTPEQIDDIVALMDNAGITWNRDEYYWDGVEKEKGVFDFSKDHFINSVAEVEGNFLLILDYGNPLYGGVPHDEQGYEAFAEYCRRMAEHVKGKINAFEIWNEWNGSFGGGYGTEEYANVLKYAAAAIKEVIPDAYIVGCATADVDMGWIEKVISAAGIDSMDAISIHPYAYPSSPESGGMKSNIRKVHDVGKKYGKDIDVWCTEMGYPAAEGVIDETTAAAYKQRIYVYSKSIGNDKLFLYDFVNDGVNPKEKEDNFGIVRAVKGENVPLAAKRDYLAISNAANILGDAQFVDVTDEDDNLQIYKFKKGSEGILSVWMLDSSANVALNVGVDSVKVTDWLGNEKTVKTQNGTLMVSASEKPVFISGNFSSYTLENSIFDFNESNISVAKGEAVNLTINRGTALENKAGSVEAKLPLGFAMKSAADFVAEGDILITLEPDETVTNGKYRAEFTIKSGDDIAGSLNANIEVVDETDIKIYPVLKDTVDFSSWKIAISVKNNSREKDIAGKIIVTEPEEYAGTVIEVPSLKFGEGYEASIETGKAPENKLIPLKVKFETKDGDVKEVSRPVSCLAAVKAKGEIKIDGVIDPGEWDNSMQFFLDDTSRIHGYRGQGELEEYSGENDLSGFGYLKWDDDAFYMLIKTKDDIHVQTSSGSGIWQGDGLQYCVDPSRGKGIGVNDWHEIGIVVDESGVTHMWKWLSIPGIAGGETKDYIGKAVRDENAETVTYEVRIPWEQLLPLGTKIAENDIIGFSVIANEDDGKGRDGWIQYMSGIGASKDALEFGDVILLGESKAQEVVLSDLNYPWADAAANALYKKGVINADYIGSKIVTKGEFADMTAKALGIAQEALGLDEDFNPGEVINREEMVVIIDNASNNGENASLELLNAFADYNKISEHARQNFANLIGRGIIAGDGTSLYPDKDADLAEAAVAIFNLIK